MVKMNIDEFSIKKTEDAIFITGSLVKADYDLNEGTILLNNETAKKLADAILNSLLEA